MLRTCLLYLALAGTLAFGQQTAPQRRQAAAPGANAAGVIESGDFMRRHLAPGKSLTQHAAAVDRLLAQMTLKEKIGQMTQLEIGLISDGKAKELKINPAKLRKAVVEYGVGSILNVNDETIAPEEWRMIITAIQDAAKETRLKIPVIYGVDSIHGANYVTGATLFPQPIGMACTWNPELMLRGSQVTAAETRAAGIPWNFSPVLDVGRQPLWPRFYETFGEDSYLATVMGVATVRGYEGRDVSSTQHVASSLKHYVGYSYPTTGHDRTPALIPENVLREHFLPTFAAAVKAGAHTVMVNSGEVNGIPGHANHHLLTTVLRGELGFKGFVVSDWEDIKKMVNIHRVAANEKEATRMAVMAGIDMSMVPSDYSFADLLLQLVNEKKVPITRINEAVRRILLVKYALGLFDDPMAGVAENTVPIGSGEARQLSLKAAQESIVLVKNQNNALPLTKTARVLVTGPTANSLVALNNGWTYTWQGMKEDLYPKDRLTLLQAVATKVGQGNVQHFPGTTYDKEVDIAAAVQAAQQADVIVVSLGEFAYAETPGNIDDLTLPEAQLRLAEQMIATGKPVVLVVIQGRPRIIRRAVEGSAAIVLAMNPSNEGGQAIADVLFGDVNPSGKLPFTYPRFPHALRTYDYKAFEAQDTSFGFKAFQPEFEFGHGLSYTTYEYSDLRVSPATLGRTGRLQISVTVRNSGTRDGMEVVPVFVSDLVATMTPPMKRLKRFAKVPLKAGEAKTVNFTLSPQELSFIGPNNKPLLESGAFEVSIGKLKQGFTLR